MADSIQRFRVTDGPLSIRDSASATGTWRGQMDNGTEIVVQADSRTEADGFVWWQHSLGWSAERKTDGSKTYMTAVGDVDSAPDTGTQTFKVTDGPLSIRDRASATGTWRGQMQNGTEIVVQADSRTEADGFVWWRHNLGWSAERKTDGSKTYLTLVSASVPADPTPDPIDPVPADPTPDPIDPVPSGQDLYFRIDTKVSIRDQASTGGKYLESLNAGDEITVAEGSYTDADGYRWRQHVHGWSAEYKLVSGERFMTQIPARTKDDPPAPDQDPIIGETGQTVTLSDGTTATMQQFISRQPMGLDQVQWIQYFGNTKFAYRIWSEDKRWYEYSQSLHAGFDYGNSNAQIPFYAGVNGTVIQLHTNSSTYAPNYLRVAVGPYLLIYGHIASPPVLQAGDKVHPDMIIGYNDPTGQQHLHFEVRYKDIHIVNPLLVMQAALRDAIMQKWSDYSKQFYSGNGYSQWQTPLDQPVLRLSSRPATIIGPHAEGK